MSSQSAISEMRNVMTTLQARIIPVSIQASNVTASNVPTMPVSEMRGELIPGKRKAYAMAGDATLTVKNPLTDGRFTYRIGKSDDGKVWFVSVLAGQDNTADYRYIGIIGGQSFNSGFRTTAKSAYPADAKCVRAFKWFYSNMESTSVQVWHEGTCGRCGRKLTVPESIASGIGPTCASKGL